MVTAILGPKHFYVDEVSELWGIADILWQIFAGIYDIWI